MPVDTGRSNNFDNIDNFGEVVGSSHDQAQSMVQVRSRLFV